MNARVTISPVMKQDAYRIGYAAGFEGKSEDLPVYLTAPQFKVLARCFMTGYHEGQQASFKLVNA